MNTPCPLLRDALDGRLSPEAARRFESHLAGCPDCQTALDAPLGLPFASLADVSCPPGLLADVLGAPSDLSDTGRLDEVERGFGALRDVPCPPEVVAAALRSARRAPDRAARPRPRSSRAAWVAALAALLAVAVGVGLRADRDRLAPAERTVAQAAPGETARPGADGRPLTDVAPPETATPPSPVTPTPAMAAPAPAVASRPPAAVSPPAPTPLRPLDPTDLAGPVDFAAADDPVPTATEIEAARRELELAFQLIAEAQSQAGDAVRGRAGSLSSALDAALPF